MVLIVITCDVCESRAAIGMDAQHALFNLTENGGRVLGDLRICPGCARHTR